MSSPFRIDILDSSNAPVGSGPLVNILQVVTDNRLDKIGTLSFTCLANDPKTREIQAGSRFDVHDEQDGYLGRYIFRKSYVSDNEGIATLTVEAWDMLKELTYTIVGFARNYNAASLESIITDLIGDVSGWTLDIGTGLGTVSVTYQGQTYYQAIEELAKRWGYHFRLGATAQELEFGAFGTTIANLRLTNLGAQNSSIDGADEIAIVKSLKQSVTDDEVYNLIVALGAGSGAAQLQLNDGETGATYTVDSRTRTNGQEELFIEDTASQTTYGIRELVLLFDQIRPIANTATAKTQAQTELLYNSEEFLTRYKDARFQLDNVQVFGLKKDIPVGDKVRLRYMGVDDDGTTYLDIDDVYWVTAHNRYRSVTGDYRSNLQLVNVDRGEKTDGDILAETVRGIRSEKLWIKPTAFRYSDTYTDTAQNSNGDYQDKDAVFTLTFDETVTDVTRVIIEWRTKPLFTTAIWNDINAVETQNANPTTPHLHTISLAGVGTDGVFTVVTSDNFPTDVSLEINGVNVDNHVSVDYLTGGTGPWNNGGTPNAALFVRMDITDFILAAAGGIYQTFEIRAILNTARTRDCAVPFWSVVNDPNNQPYGNQGIFEMKILSQGVCQAVYKD